MQQAYFEYPNERFVSAINAVLEPAIVVATDLQV